MPAVLSLYVKTNANDAANYITTFNKPISLDPNRLYLIALKHCSIYNDDPNISKNDLDNHILRYKKTSDLIWIEIELDEGLYSLNDLQNEINYSMNENGREAEIGSIILYPHIPCGKIRLELSNDYQLDLSIGNLYKMLGADNVIYNPGITRFTRQANFSRYDVAYINSSLVCNAYRGGTSGSEILMQCHLNSGPPKALIEISPRILTWVAMNPMDRISNFRMYITDNNNRLLKLSRPSEFALIIKPADE